MSQPELFGLMCIWIAVGAYLGYVATDSHYHRNRPRHIQCPNCQYMVETKTFNLHYKHCEH